MTNLSIFERNVIHAFAGAAPDAEVIEEASAVFLRLKEDGALRAEAAAYELIDLLEVVGPMLAAAVRPFDPATGSEVRGFLRDRWWFWRHPAQRRVPFEEGSRA